MKELEGRVIEAEAMARAAGAGLEVALARAQTAEREVEAARRRMEEAERRHADDISSLQAHVMSLPWMDAHAPV